MTANEIMKSIKDNLNSVEQNLEQIQCDDVVSCDFQIGDEVRIIGSDPIYDDCDVGWVIRNASEKVKTMYVMRNDGSAGEETKAEWYKTGKHNNMLAEVIKALPYVKPQEPTGKWIGIDEEPHEVWECDHCGFVIDGSGCIDPYDYRDTYKFCPNCGAKMEVSDGIKI